MNVRDVTTETPGPYRQIDEDHGTPELGPLRPRVRSCWAHQETSHASSHISATSPGTIDMYDR